MEISGKVVVVTGASMGIGEAIAKLFADYGARVVLLSRDAARAEVARGRIGHTENTIALSCDVRNREEIDRVLGLTLHHFGRVDVWINNAGRGLIASVASMNPEDYRDIFETNLFGTIASMQAVLPVMKQQHSGSIINISSVAGHIPLPYGAVYSATKFAMNAIGKAAGVELRKSGIHVMTVCPGYIATEFHANAIQGNERGQVRPQKQRGVTADRVARAVVNGYIKQKREVVVPGYYRVFIKLYQLWPGLVEWSMIRLARANEYKNLNAEAAEKQRNL